MAEHRQSIMAKASELRAVDPLMGTRTAWNYATTAQLNELKQDHPTEWEQMDARAAALRQSSETDFADQDPAVLER